MPILELIISSNEKGFKNFSHEKNDVILSNQIHQ
jgi:hypothetical protein